MSGFIVMVYNKTCNVSVACLYQIYFECQNLPLLNLIAKFELINLRGWVGVIIFKFIEFPYGLFQCFLAILKH